MMVVVTYLTAKEGSLFQVVTPAELRVAPCGTQPTRQTVNGHCFLQRVITVAMTTPFRLIPVEGTMLMFQR